MLVDDRELTQSVERMEALLADLESFPDPSLRARAAEIVQGLLALYGEGLARILATVEERAEPETAGDIFHALAADELVSHLLLLHDLHPVPIEQRITHALEEVRPYLESHGGNVEFVGVREGVAHLRMQGSCSGCPSSTVTLKLAIEDAIMRAAPDLEGIEAEGVAQPPPRPIAFLSASDIIPLKEKRQPNPGPAWTEAGNVAGLPDGGMRTVAIAGNSVLFLSCGDTLYAYRNACASCGAALQEGSLTGPVLSCPSCNQSYDIHHAGRRIDDTGSPLQAIPLLNRDGTVKIALGDG